MKHPDYGLENSAEGSPICDQDKRIPNSPNSITTTDGGIRKDPEGVAPEGGSLIT